MSFLAYRLFLDPLPAWEYWYLTIIPLCFAVAVVYKSMKCRTFSRVPLEATIVVIWILGGFTAAALGLMLLVNWLGK